MKVLHLCTQKGWRGGENQIRLLIEHTPDQTEHFVAIPQKSRGFERFSNLVPTLGLPSSSAYHPLSIYKIIQFCRKNKIDILDGQGSGGLTLALLTQTFLPRVKIVHHRRVAEKVAQNFFSRRKYLSPRLNKIVAISNHIKEVLIECGVPAEKITVVRSSVDYTPYEKLDKARLRQQLVAQYSLNPSAQIILTASALVEDKGLQFLALALREFKKRHPDKSFYWLAAGEGKDAVHFKRLIKDLQLDENVLFLGHITNIAEFLSSGDFFVLPSLTEGLGTISLESCLAKTFVLASRTGGIPEVILDQQTGLLFEPSSFMDIYRALLKVLDMKPEEKQKIISQAYEHAKNSFSLEQMVSGNLKVYSELFNQSVQ